MNQTDLDRIADNLRTLATELEDGTGLAALERAWSWRGPIRGASYDPSGRHYGHRHDEYTEPVLDDEGEPVLDDDGRPVTELVAVAVPNDPTGEADLHTTDQLRHPRLVAAVGALDTAATTLEHLIVATVPELPTPDDDPGDGWCRSCYRDRRTLTPEDTHADGRTKHANACKWCANFRSSHGIDPPIPLLRKRHDGHRISPTDVKNTLDAVARYTRKRRGA